jgi:hypothetical protein
MHGIKRIGGWRWMLSAALLGAMGVAIAEDTTPVAAVGQWQRHEYDFHYMGFTSRYSCDGLSDTLKRVLVASGARADVVVTPGACAMGMGRPDRFASARIVFSTLSPTANAPAAEGAIQGVWKPVVIESRQPLGLGNGDCELIEQFRDRVLIPMMPIRGLKEQITCIPHQESGSHYRLSFEVLVPLLDANGATVPAEVLRPEMRLYAYPLRGQSAEQEAADRGACEASVASLPPDATRNEALARCLVERGYVVR